MKKKLTFLIFVLALVATSVFADDLIDLGRSNQAYATMGFERNEYDWLLNPIYVDRIGETSFFFALDGNGPQFGAASMGDGFRGAFALVNDGFSPVGAVNFRTTSTSATEKGEDNIELTYGSYDIATGRYATIDEAVTIASNDMPYYTLALHFGMLGSGTNFAAQARWVMDRAVGSSQSYTDNYTNTSAPSAATLATKGNQTATTYDLIDGANAIIIEPEIGLSFGAVQSRIAIGAAWHNPGSATDQWMQTVTSYSAGADPTASDTDTITSRSGSYTGAAATPRFNMNTTAPTNPERIGLNLHTETVLPLSENIELEVPAYVNYGLYAFPLSTINKTETVNYDDSAATQSEIGRTSTTTTTTLSKVTDFSFGTGATVRTSVSPSDNTRLHFGAGLAVDGDLYGDTRTSAQATANIVDANADGTREVDTLTTLSGWEIQNNSFSTAISLSVPISASYSPVKPLTFHAGATTSFRVNLASSNSLQTGDNGYMYEMYTDNITAANSYAATQQIDGSSNSNLPSKNFSSQFTFSAAGSFGFTLDFSDNFRIDALATTGSSVAIDQFTVSGTYSPRNGGDK
jgi:hypothetical protein